VRSNTRTNLSLAGAILILAVFAWVLTACSADQSQAEKPAGVPHQLSAGPSPLGPHEELPSSPSSIGAGPNGNSMCYVCHPGLKTEELTTVHLEISVTCNECHGPTVHHMHDEMLMTKPDLLFGRAEVNKMCSNPTCHKPGGERIVYGFEDHKDTAAVKAFHKKWLGRTRPNGRAIAIDSVCTDCHGTHNLDEPITQSEQAGEWINAFNGRDLKGWRPSGAASWRVKRDRIVATAGPNGEGGTLWTEAIYQDYLLSVTFRTTRPIHAGIWLRAAGSERGPRVEIFDNQKPTAFTGSVWLPGKGLVLANLREDLVDRESWNTISVKVRGDRVGVWLNGEEVGAIRISGPAKGKIGLHIEKGPVSGGGELCVREVLVQRLGEPVEKASTPSQD